MKKRIISLLMCALMAVSMFAACGKDNGGGSASNVKSFPILRGLQSEARSDLLKNGWKPEQNVAFFKRNG